ncbi:DUF1294 domain-containing protein [Neisseria weixii]|uniref:DUF1294 domain-containing protein n=1 Tax=Neisseria weixii TaxID=1853276 RepID=UPI000BB83EEF|nr:DUF1294 domain-containing protein [Neisseria weixii]ATD64357.1 DNA-binding protein [Neisseria weixii]
MTQEKYYGTILHWFNDMQRGTIMAETGQRIFADGLSLAADYLAPQTGDRVCFNLDHSQHKPSAQNITLAERVAPAAQKTTITIVDWDFMQNGGFGKEVGNPTPIFILGQFLADQSRVPEIGDRFKGNLFQHENGQWMMTDATFLPPPEAEPLFQTASIETATDTATLPTEQPRIIESIYKLYKAPEPETLTELPVNQVLSGEVTSWDDVKGYGFIRYGSDAQTVFFHISSFHYATARPKIGQSVSFYCKPTVKEERQKAAKVVLRGDEVSLHDDFPSDYNRPRLSTANMPRFLINILIATVFTVCVASVSKILAGLYFAVSVVSYLMYKFDKQIARNPKKKSYEYQGRIPEKNLHILDTLGGWPGALVSRAVYNHKTSKISFIRLFWLTVAINIAITYALLIHYADNPLLSLLRN